MYKQVIIVRKDLKMGAGKTSAQVAHASVDSMMNSDKKIAEAWREEGMKKVVLKVNSEKELLDCWHLAKAAKLSTALIRDAGKTQVEPGTITCLGIGPEKEEKIDKITGNLKIL